MIVLAFAASLAVDVVPYNPDLPPLHIYGGEGYKTYLGCLNCASEDQSSIWNKRSKYGKLSAADSIWNRKGKFGSAGSGYSPWHKNSNGGPVLLDSTGEYYGKFSATSDDAQTLIRWAAWLAENHKEVRENISEYRERFSSKVDKADPIEEAKESPVKDMVAPSLGLNP